MVLELVYFDNKRRVSQRTSKQIWDLLYKETIAPNVIIIEGGKEDTTQGGDHGHNDETELEEEEMEDPLSLEEDPINETSLGKKNMENIERER